jgi:hypothetical protein
MESENVPRALPWAIFMSCLWHLKTKFRRQSLGPSWKPFHRMGRQPALRHNPNNSTSHTEGSQCDRPRKAPENDCPNANLLGNPTDVRRRTVGFHGPSSVKQARSRESPSANRNAGSTREKGMLQLCTWPLPLTKSPKSLAILGNLSAHTLRASVPPSAADGRDQSSLRSFMTQ